MRRIRVFHLSIGLLALLLLLVGCKSPKKDTQVPEKHPPPRLRLATTTSTANSGLLDYLLPMFEEKHNIRVDVLPVGTGQALRLGERGDVDAVLVHAPGAEKEFVDKGFGVNRRAVMYNDFVVAGPAAGTAEVKHAKSAADALRRIANANADFISRGDDSGTHKKELALWRGAGIEPAGGWYHDAGQGMGMVLQVASERRAYTLTDRGTYLSMKDKLELAILFEGDPALHNPYGIIAVSPARYPAARYAEAMLLIAWLTSPEGQMAIREFEVDGEALFHPLAVPKE